MGCALGWAPGTDSSQIICYCRAVSALGSARCHLLFSSQHALKIGIRRVLYLDTDTCLLASPRAIFEAGSAQPNPLLAARRDLGYTPPARLQKLAAANRLDLRAAAARWNHAELSGRACRTPGVHTERCE